MIGWQPFLAADVIPQPTRVPRLLASDLVVIIGLSGLIFALFIAYFVFIRGSKSQLLMPARKAHRDSPLSEDEGSNGGRKRKKKRVRRRDHRQRNPTLSQTGGLPPPRDEQESSSPIG